MYSTKQNKLMAVRDAIMDGRDSICDMQADSLTIGEALQLVKLEMTIFNARYRAAKAIDKMVQELDKPYDTAPRQVLLGK